MVVGIRHTSKATNTVIVIGAPLLAADTLNRENGSKVTVTSRNTMVSATSKIVRAISFGVFWRLALSTIEIMRSRKASPGLTDTRTISQSESIRVPPVTAEKSPPDSRITGADSPVIALSSTEATPSMTSPSTGITSPASTSTTSPLRRLLAGVADQLLSWPLDLPLLLLSSFLAETVCFKARNDSACALLRPSASASAKLANRTVNQSQTEIARMNAEEASPLPIKAWKYSSVVRILPI